MIEEDNKMSKAAESKKWFVCDPCGITCAVVTYILVLYGEFVVLFILAPPFLTTGTLINVVIFTTLGFLAVASHLKAMLTDPGVVPHESASEEDVLQRRQKGEDIKYCKKCRSIKPERAHHCSTCERCIHKMDHHCPWVNNCVGAKNQKFFVLFTFYIMILSIYGLLMVAWFFFNCVQQNFDGCDSILPGPLVFILTIFGVFEGLLFSLFTCIMFCTQIHSIATDETGIESLKKETRQKKSLRESFTDVFGSPPSLKWFSPFTPPSTAEKKCQLTSVCTSV